MSKPIIQKKKKKRFSFASVICITFVLILCMGSFASIIGSTSGSASSSSGGHKQPVQNILPDQTGPVEPDPTPEPEPDPMDLIINKELYTPKNATVISQLAFADVEKYDHEYLSENKGAIKNLILSDKGVNGFVFSTENGYFKISGAEDEEGCFFSFRTLNPGSSDLLDVSDYSYLSIDFDVWSDSSLPDRLQMYFKGKTESDSSVSNSIPILDLKRNDDGNFVYGQTILDLSKPIHITILIKICTDGSHEVLTYIDGKYYFADVNLFSFSYLQLFQIYMPLLYNSESLCVDNIQILGFCHDDSFVGGINECFNDSNINLADLSGSVLYVTKND